MPPHVIALLSDPVWEGLGKKLTLRTGIAMAYPLKPLYTGVGKGSGSKNTTPRRAGGWIEVAEQVLRFLRLQPIWRPGSCSLQVLPTAEIAEALDQPVAPNAST